MTTPIIKTIPIIIYFFIYLIYHLRYLLATLKANEVKIMITDANKNRSIVGFGPVLSGVVKTIIIPITAKAIDAQTNTFVAIFCMVLVYQLKQSSQTYLVTRQFISKDMEYLSGIFHLENLKQNNWNLFSEILPKPNLFKVNSISITIFLMLRDTESIRTSLVQNIWKFYMDNGVGNALFSR